MYKFAVCATNKKKKVMRILQLMLLLKKKKELCEILITKRSHSVYRLNEKAMVQIIHHHQEYPNTKRSMC